MLVPYRKYGKADKIIVAPIIEWSDKDVWDFIKGNGIEYCQLYDEGWKRIGCLFCPMARKSEMRCPKCKKENYALAVAVGICVWCGFDGRDLLKDK